MTVHIIVVENLKDWTFELPGLDVVSANDYLLSTQRYKGKGTRVINLCRNFRYLSIGYYCSLLGEARRHRVLPGMQVITSLSAKSIYGLNISDMDEKIQQAIKRLKLNAEQESIDLNLMFGVSDIKELQDLGRLIFEAFPAPMLRVEFKKHKQWQIASIRTLALHQLNETMQTFFVDSLSTYMQRRWAKPKLRNQFRYDMAILHDPEERLPPSNKKALKSFVNEGKKLGINVELITRKDFNRLAEYDALFIRETTAINHYTYRFAKKAQSEGMVVIDDPDSIIKCCNKVYLAELLKLHGIKTPRTEILRKGESLSAMANIGFPMVLKIPDGSFSRGMYKAESLDEAKQFAALLFRESDLILAQEFLYTEYDWRIGILNDEVLFACQYFMSPSHWQIVQHNDNGAAVEGDFACLSLDSLSPALIETAQSAARLIGNGLYGVDLKERNGEVYVMEINDNPNIESGVEDQIMGNALYQQIWHEFIRRIEVRRGNR